MDERNAEEMARDRRESRMFESITRRSGHVKLAIACGIIVAIAAGAAGTLVAIEIARFLALARPVTALL